MRKPPEYICGRPGRPAAATSQPLSGVEAGFCVRLAGLDAGRGLASRLEAMGLTPGCEITILSNPVCGPILLAVGDTRLSLGRGVADKILVE